MNEEQRMLIDDLASWEDDPSTGVDQHAQALKKAGMKLAADNRPGALALAREIAEELANEKSHLSHFGGAPCRIRTSRNLTIDDVRRAYEARGGDWSELGNAAGSVFKGKGWEWTGRFVASTHAASHGRMVREWRWVG